MRILLYQYNRILDTLTQRKKTLFRLFLAFAGVGSEIMSIGIDFSQKTTVKTEKGQEVLKLSPLPKRAKRTYLAMDKDKEVLGYVVPVFRAR